MGKIKTIRTIFSYLFSVPACILFLISEKIRGDKLGWRVEEIISDLKPTCSKCGHSGNLKLLLNGKK